MRNTLDQLNLVGPGSLGVCLLTAAFVGMVFTIQFIRRAGGKRWGGGGGGGWEVPGGGGV